MPFSNLPWLNSSPQLFLEALKAGTEASIAQERNRLEGASQGLQAALAHARNETEREQIRQAGEIAKSRLAQANEALGLRAQLGEDRLSESERHHQGQEQFWNNRNSVLQDQLASKDTQFATTMAARDLEDKIKQQNADSVTNRLGLTQAAADAKAKALIDKTNITESPTIDFPKAGSKGHTGDPVIQSLLAPHDEVTTNTPGWFRRTIGHLPLVPEAPPISYSTNSVSLAPEDVTSQQLLQAYGNRKPLTQTLTAPDVLDIPGSQKDLVPGKQYNTKRGVATWDGDSFVQ